MAKKFSKTVEDFTCTVCGQKVVGTGYTDHCPNCLWSKHVDINPGDRADNCGGLMKPLGLDKRHSVEQILYRCQKCGQQRFNKVSPQDNQNTLIEISKKPVKDQKKLN